MRVTVRWDLDTEDLRDMDYPSALEVSGLPEQVIIPKETIQLWEEEERDDDVIDQWLSDEYGFCHYGWTEVGEDTNDKTIRNKS